MRTTLTLDDDVAEQIEQVRRSTGASLRAVVNAALRQGLQPGERTQPPKPFGTRTFDMGPANIPIANVAEALAHAEGEAFK